MVVTIQDMKEQMSKTYFSISLIGDYNKNVVAHIAILELAASAFLRFTGFGSAREIRAFCLKAINVL